MHIGPNLLPREERKGAMRFLLHYLRICITRQVDELTMVITPIWARSPWRKSCPSTRPSRRRSNWLTSRTLWS